VAGVWNYLALACSFWQYDWLLNRAPSNALNINARQAASGPTHLFPARMKAIVGARD
jgi:hypothetical protein